MQEGESHRKKCIVREDTAPMQNGLDLADEISRTARIPEAAELSRIYEKKSHQILVLLYLSVQAALSRPNWRSASACEKGAKNQGSLYHTA